MVHDDDALEPDGLLQDEQASQCIPGAAASNATEEHICRLVRAGNLGLRR